MNSSIGVNLLLAECNALDSLDDCLLLIRPILPFHGPGAAGLRGTHLIHTCAGRQASKPAGEHFRAPYRAHHQ